LAGRSAATVEVTLDEEKTVDFQHSSFIWWAVLELPKRVGQAKENKRKRARRTGSDCERDDNSEEDDNEKEGERGSDEEKPTKKRGRFEDLAEDGLKQGIEEEEREEKAEGYQGINEALHPELLAMILHHTTQKSIAMWVVCRMVCRAWKDAVLDVNSYRNEYTRSGRRGNFACSGHSSLRATHLLT